MARAPLLLQRSLVFPYMDGLNFETQLLAKGWEGGGVCGGAGESAELEL